MSIEKPETNAETILPIMERDYQARIAALQSANEALGQANTGLALNYQQAQERIDALVKQLPDEMQDCTIRFKECTKCQRGWLQPDNWVDHGCPHCARDAMQTTINVLAKANADLTKHRDELVENATQHERRMAQALHHRLVARDELYALRQQYSSLLRQHERLREAYGVTNTLTPGEPVAADTLGPIYKDDLCPDALRDGYLRRSAESRKRRTAKPPKQEGDYGIEIIANGQTECMRKDCPTQQPHRHITDPNENLDHIIAARRARMMATIADADSDAPGRTVPPQHTINNDAVNCTQCHGDAFPTKENPNHAKAPMDVNNIVGGPNEPALAAERREVFEQAAAEVLNQAFDANKEFGISDETSNTPDKGTEQR